MNDFVEALIKGRYFRKTIAVPKGSIVHDGDCQVFRVHICTCGLLHTLMPYPEDAKRLYPKYWDEVARQDMLLDHIFENDELREMKPKKLSKEEIKSNLTLLRKIYGK